MKTKRGLFITQTRFERNCSPRFKNFESKQCILRISILALIPLNHQVVLRLKQIHQNDYSLFLLRVSMKTPFESFSKFDFTFVNHIECKHCNRFIKFFNVEIFLMWNNFLTATGRAGSRPSISSKLLATAEISMISQNSSRGST